MRPRRWIAVVLLALYLSACAHYQATQEPLAQLTAPPKPVRQARVTLTDGRRVQVTNPRVEADTLRGAEGYDRTSGPPVAIPLADITGVEVVPRSNTGKTLLIVGGVALGVGIFAWVAHETDEYCDSFGC